MAVQGPAGHRGDGRHRHPAWSTRRRCSRPVVHRGRQLRHERVPAAGMDYYTVDGVLWPASVNLSGALLYYNKGHFRRPGSTRHSTPEDPRRGPRVRPEDQGRRRRRQARGPEGQLAAASRCGSPAPAQPVVNNDNGRGTGTTDRGRVRQRHHPRAVHVDQVDVERRAAHGHPRHPGQIDQYLAMAQRQGLDDHRDLDRGHHGRGVPSGGTASTRGSVGAADAATVDPAPSTSARHRCPASTRPGRLQMGGGAWYITNTGTPEEQAAAWDFMKFFNSLESPGHLEHRRRLPALPHQPPPRTRGSWPNWTNTLSGRWLAIAYDELLNGVDPNFPGPLMGPYDQFRKAIRARSRTWCSTARHHRTS